jgi:hypothetical protein
MCKDVCLWLWMCLFVFGHFFCWGVGLAGFEAGNQTASVCARAEVEEGLLQFMLGVAVIGW